MDRFKSELKKNLTIYNPAMGRLIWAINRFLFIVLMAAEVIASVFHGFLTVQIHGETVLTFYIVPALLIGGLYGYVLALVSFSMALIANLIYSMETAYCISIALVATMSFAMFSQFGFFESWKKTGIACLVTIILTNLTEFLCLTVLAEAFFELRSFEELFGYVYRECLAIIGTGVFLHILFGICPDKVKFIFPLGFGYTQFYRENEEMQRGIRKTRVSSQITIIIITVELILGISVSIFMMVLFPDIKGMIVNNYNVHVEENLHVVSGTEKSEADEDAEDFLNRINNMQYRFNDSALILDIKMVLLMLCVGVPLAGLTNYYVKVRIGEPLGLMSDFMYEYASSDYNKIEVGHKIDKIHITNKDEIGVVYESIRSTVYEMEAYINRLKEEQRLESELEVAKKANEAKSAFLSNMSHEIRTPINAVLGMNEMILREGEDEQILEYASSIKSAGNSLLSLVNDILDFSKIEAGKMEILPVQYHLGSLINDLINMISAKATDKGLDLIINVDEHTPASLIGDEVRIKQCVTNILTNAVKYTEKGSVTLNISYNRVNDKNINLKFQVIDTGIGIKEEDLSKLYSPFERIEEIRNRTIEGTGLGMSIVKKLLAMMDTKLEVKSVYGEGSDFSFEVKQQIVSWEEIGDFKEKYKDYIQSTGKYHQRFNAPDARILIVDDTEMNLTVMKSLLKKTQIQIDTADSGRKTLEMIKKSKYDVIFLDHRMPEMDGIETYECMKTLEGNLNIDTPVIALTANAVSGAREEYLTHGFKDYLSKPVNGILLEEMLEHYIPVDKIQSVSIQNGDDKYQTQLLKEIPEDSFLRELQDVDLEMALENCGSVDTLETVVKDFYISIENKADAIETYLYENDIKNYTVLVHALKSSARLIGAEELSNLAAQMEKSGNENDIEIIKQKTPELLVKYRGYKNNLVACQKNQRDNLPEIDKSSLEEAFSNIREMVEVFDFDSADSIMKMLQDYSIPDEYKEKYESLVELITAVDREKILELI